MPQGLWWTFSTDSANNYENESLKQTDWIDSWKLIELTNYNAVSDINNPYNVHYF